MERNSNDLVELLLSNRATVNANNHDGNTPLHLASMMDDDKVIELLISHGATINPLGIMI
ncbi:ankyrin repeat protein, putative [Trichomonas vaginalis G3]|uniref:Ankyrin repeat protein, putative n=1 Tax=Trichomonas vaginalis (strain ATCC PRA-98 / G3) TaxID=412133 RepID=A2FN67_TRIV3|nr:putative GTP-ase activating proteins for the small GTPase, ARF family [Trichomonas vaginalis G3]EAX93667.1 ankyrin repeat protein, putative [Trichomonas vaginalis G3]KAI5522835.1 putative GTP-ase activating proteins for the small GTPase, ARF family [Trichomonas vaginalis G3]|eukprot:XP_001306597.1 ankyrin repeat protein [Trichomonas vaginalis G3]